jgi:deoxycytidylate deaminase
MILMEAMRLGKQEAMKSPVHNRYGAVLVHRNKIISTGYNIFKGPVHYNNLRQCVLCR